MSNNAKRTRAHGASRLRKDAPTVQDDDRPQFGRAKALAHAAEMVRRARGGDVAELPGYRGEVLRGLELAAKWLWRDGRPRAVLTAGREIVWCNPAARRLLVPPSPLIIKRHHLCPAKGVDIEPVDAFIAAIGAETSRLQVMDADSDRGVLLTAWTETVDGVTTAFVEFGLRELPFDAERSGMARLFGLTKAECRVVDAMVTMEPPTEIAARLGVSVNTVRTHIRRIYGKLAVRSQLQFMRLTMAYCGA